jgi:hypothetical protein
MNLEQLRACSLFRRGSNSGTLNLPLASSLEKTGGNRRAILASFFPHNGPVFNKCPRLISKDLITARYQPGICGSNSEFMRMNEERKKLRNRFFVWAKMKTEVGLQRFGMCPKEACSLGKYPEGARTPRARLPDWAVTAESPCRKGHRSWRLRRDACRIPYRRPNRSRSEFRCPRSRLERSRWRGGPESKWLAKGVLQG